MLIRSGKPPRDIGESPHVTTNIPMVRSIDKRELALTRTARLEQSNMPQHTPRQEPVHYNKRQVKTGELLIDNNRTTQDGDRYEQLNHEGELRL